MTELPAELHVIIYLMNSIEIIARALIIKNNKILLCRGVSEGEHYFLPGGHVEFGESGEITLKREMREEVNADISNLNYVGLFENKFSQKEKIHHEINIIYTAEIENENVVSQEAHIIFEWMPFGEFKSIKFLPTIFADELQRYFFEPKQIYLSSL